MSKQISHESRKEGLVEIFYKSIDDFLVDYSRELSKGSISIIAREFPFEEKQLIDVELNLPGAKQPIQIVTRIIGLQQIPGRDGTPRKRVTLFFGEIPQHVSALLDDYFKDLTSKKSIKILKKRGHDRFHVKLPAMVHTEHGDIEGKITDISLGGAKMLSEATLMMEQEIGCMIILPDMKRLFVKAIIQKVMKAEDNSFHYPIKFIEFEANSKLDLKTYIQSLEEKNSP
jgi:PilZ domain